MVQIQGIKLGFTMAALVFALLTVNTLSAATGVGVELTTGGIDTADVEQVSGEFKDPGVSGAGTQDPGFFGVAVGVSRTINQLWTLTTGVGGMLESWGVPAVIGLGIQGMIDLTMGLAGLQIISRYKF